MYVIGYTNTTRNNSEVILENNEEVFIKEKKHLKKQESKQLSRKSVLREKVNIFSQLHGNCCNIP